LVKKDDIRTEVKRTLYVTTPKKQRQKEQQEGHHFTLNVKGSL